MKKEVTKPTENGDNLDMRKTHHGNDVSDIAAKSSAMRHTEKPVGSPVYYHPRPYK